MQRIFRELLLYVLAMVVAVAATSAASFWLLGASYAGVSDDAAVQAGIEASRGYLRQVAGAMARVVVVQALVLAGLTFGAASVRMGDRPARHRWQALLRSLGWAMLVLVAWIGARAYRHAGLFLPILSSGTGAIVWVGVARFVWPAIVLASAMGWIRLVTRARSKVEKSSAVAMAMFTGAWLWMFELRAPDRFAAAERGAQAAPVAAPPRARPNILLVAVDSLRPDKIDERSTPALARLCKESIYFPNTLVTLPRTAPSWAAMLTSLSPLANGVETMFPTEQRSRLTTLAMPAHLASMGYATSAFSEYAGEFFGRLDLGFEQRSAPRVELEQIVGQSLFSREPFALAAAGDLYAGPASLRRLLPSPLPELLRGSASFSQPAVLGEELVDSLDRARPWLAALFYSQPHFPYTSSSSFRERFSVPGSDPALRFGKDVTRGEVRTPADRAQVEGLYRAALAETDAAIADVLARLSASGELADTIVIVTADHGEGLYECPSCVGHGDNLTGMMSLTVPLAIRLPSRRFPRARPQAVPAYVSQLDVYPTVLELLGAPPLPTQEGIALLDRQGGLAPAPSERVFFSESGEWLWPTAAVPADRLAYPPITALASIERGRIVIDEKFLPAIRAAKQRAAIAPPFKLVYRPGARRATWSLYRFDRDPFDLDDLTEREPVVAAKLRAALVHSVLRFSQMVPVADYFLTRPAPPPEEYY